MSSSNYINRGRAFIARNCSDVDLLRAICSLTDEQIAYVLKAFDNKETSYAVEVSTVKVGK